MTSNVTAPVGEQVVGLLFALGGRLRGHLADVAASVDLTPMQARALHHLGSPCQMGDVANRLDCDASNITGIVDRLEERGLVVRQPDPGDRRRRLLVTTPTGEAVRVRMHERMLVGHPVIAGLDETQQLQFRDLLATALAAPDQGGDADR